MHMFYENAAHLLLVMTRVGVAIKAGSDCHAILMCQTACNFDPQSACNFDPSIA